MPEDSARFPVNLKFWPLVGLKSFHLPEASGAWRMMVLVKNLADMGQSRIERERLKEFATFLGVSDKQFRRWLTAARNYDMIQDVQSKEGTWMVIHASNEKIAEYLGCDSMGPFVTMPADMLFKKNWRANVFASWQSAYTGNGARLVSQKKQAEITGISEQTQRKFNQEAGVQSERNYAISNIHANGYSVVLDFGNRAGLFQYWDKEKHQKYLGWRIPNSRYFPLFGIGGSHKPRRTLSLFNRTSEQYKASMKAIRKADPIFQEVYIYDRKSHNGYNLWIHYPLGE